MIGLRQLPSGCLVGGMLWTVSEQKKGPDLLIELKADRPHLRHNSELYKAYYKPLD